MHFNTRTSLRDKLLLALLATSIAGLIALVSNGGPWPKLFGPAPAPAVARGHLPATLSTIRLAETKDAFSLQAAFNRIGFDLESVAAGYISVPRIVLASLPANLDRLDGMDERKDLFLRTLLPVVLDVNDRILEDRARLLVLRDKLRANVTLSGEEVAWVMVLADAYDQPDADLDALVKKVDVVPPSLALAQAIEESGWGSSRIAKDRNALFGQFGQTDVYRSFTSLSEAVGSYARNLNTHRAYREFRQTRARMRARAGEIDPTELASTLHHYSERGDDYVQSVRSIMRANGLVAFDGARLVAKRGTAIIESKAEDGGQIASAQPVTR